MFAIEFRTKMAGGGGVGKYFSFGQDFFGLGIPVDAKQTKIHKYI